MIETKNLSKQFKAPTEEKFLFGKKKKVKKLQKMK